MPLCPKCGIQYPSGTSKCSDCGIELSENNSAGESKTETDIKTMLLFRSNDIAIIRILEETLKSRDIPCLVKSSMGTYSGYLPVDQVMKGLKIFVAESDFKKSVEVAEIIIPDYKVPDENK